MVAIRAIGLNQSDYKYVLGRHFPPEALPSCVAHEAVGEIIELGPDTGAASGTKTWEIGDRVALMPMLADRAAIGALRQFGVYDQSALLPVPDHYSDEEGAAYWNAILTIAAAMDMGPGTGNQQGKDDRVHRGSRRHWNRGLAACTGLGRRDARHHTSPGQG